MGFGEGGGGGGAGRGCIDVGLEQRTGVKSRPFANCLCVNNH